MKTITTFCKAILIALLLININLFASSSNSQHSVFKAVSSINKEWNNPNFDTKDIKTLPCDFENLTESEKIQLHLREVDKLLRNNPSENLTPNQIANRQKNIELLKGYCQQGVFPRNLTHKNRIPVFVDDRNVPCAVGYLMLKSGYKDFVTQTQKKANNIYIKEIESDIFNNFQKESGLSFDELALIQPAYGEYIIVDRITQGNVDVQATVSDNENNIMYVAGKLEGLNQQGISTIAKYDGKHWIIFPNEVSGNFKTMAIVNGDLYIAGQLKIGVNQTPANLVSYSSKGWQIIPISGEIRILYPDADKLYIGGNFKIGEESNFAIYDTKNSKFEATNAKFNAPINAITVYNGEIVVGGEFTMNSSENQLYLSQNNGKKWNTVAMANVDIVYSLYSGRIDYNDTTSSLVVGYGCNEDISNCDKILYYRNTNGWKKINMLRGLNGSLGGLDPYTQVKNAKISQIIKYQNTPNSFGYYSVANVTGSTDFSSDTTMGVIPELNFWSPTSRNGFPKGIVNIQFFDNYYIFVCGDGQLYKSTLIRSDVDFENPYKDEITTITNSDNNFVFKFSNKAEKNLSFKLFNLLGEELINQTESFPNKDILTVAKGNLASGCYVANIIKDNKSYNIKVLVKN